MILFFSIWCGMKSWGMESTIISIGPLKRYVLTSTTVKRALVVGPLICYFLQLFLPRIIILYWFRFCSVLLPLLPLFSPLSFFSSFLQSINLTIVNLRKKRISKVVLDTFNLGESESDMLFGNKAIELHILN